MTEGARYVYPRVGEWVTRRAIGNPQFVEKGAWYFYIHFQYRIL